MKRSEKAYLKYLIQRVIEECNIHARDDQEEFPITIGKTDDMSQEFIDAATARLEELGFDVEFADANSEGMKPIDDLDIFPPQLGVGWHEVPRWLYCDHSGDTYATPIEFILHARRPRFILLYNTLDESTHPLWIDKPEPTVNIPALIDEAMQFYYDYSSGPLIPPEAEED